MTLSSNNSDHAVSAYAPIRRNSFLQHSTSWRTFLSSGFTLGLTLIVIHFWKDARIWHELLARVMPRHWQPVLQNGKASALGVLRGVLQWLQLSLEEHPPTKNQADAPTSILCDGSSSPVSAVWGADASYYEDRIRQNQALIRKVLAYWFGQYEPDEAQKKLWMIAASSGEWRKQIDAEIADLFTPLLLELAAAALDNPSQPQRPCRWQQWCVDNDVYGYPGKLAAIIVLDQFSRHIRRHHEQRQVIVGHETLPPQSQLDALALRTARLLTEAHSPEIRCGMIPLPQHIFGLMPYRHAGTLTSVQTVQTCIETTAQLQSQLEGMIGRFRKATNRRMAVLQDEARRTGRATTAAAAATRTTAQDNEGNVATANTSEFSDHDILETFPFEADMADAADHPVVKTIRSFLAEQGVCPVGGRAAIPNTTHPTKKSNRNKEPKTKNKNLKAQQPRPQKTPTAEAAHVDSPPPRSVVVSLSGGVDSMVIASVLAYLKSNGGYPHLNLVAIHIDYANRPESQAESDYVRRYCVEKGVRFVVQRIEEVTRGVTARDEYEQRARDIRYDLYRTVARQCQSATDDGDDHSPSCSVVGIMLGHHRGDLRENVLSNAHKGCGPLDLSGMTAVSQNNGVTIYRPLLPLEKTDVLDYAHRYGVPYFKDTTPHWSTRGKLRNKLLPLLEEIYGEGSMNNLSTLATDSDECRHLMHSALLKPFMDLVVRTPMGIIFETAPFVAEARGLFFWKFVLREVLHSAGLGMFSDKSVISFLERVQPTHTFKKTIREGWLQCRRDYAVYLQGDGKVFVFYPESFPWKKSDGFKCSGKVFDLNQQTSVAVGPWTVEANQGFIRVEQGEDVIKRKAVASMEKFMQGFVEYYLEVPTIEEKMGDKVLHVPTPLVFAPAFRKETRPTAWKGTDEKIQEILPLLGLSEESFQSLKHPTYENPVALVRVTLDRRLSSD